MRSRFVGVCALAMAACQPAPQPIDQATLRDHLLKGMADPPSTVAESLRSRGFRCEDARPAWVKAGTAIGCSRNNGGKFLNVELASTAPGARLSSYRIYETGEPLYGKGHP